MQGQVLEADGVDTSRRGLEVQGEDQVHSVAKCQRWKRFASATVAVSSDSGPSCQVPELRPRLRLLNILNSATRYRPNLPANTVPCCHPVHKHPAMGGSREKAASSTPEACWSVSRSVTNGMVRRLQPQRRYKG